VRLAALRRQVEALSKKYRRRRPTTVLDVILGAARVDDLAPADRALFDSLHRRPDGPDPFEQLIEEARRPQGGVTALPPGEGCLLASAQPGPTLVLHTSSGVGRPFS
jgi:hypothetical protein